MEEQEVPTPMISRSRSPGEIGEAEDRECPHCSNVHESLECPLLSPPCGQPASSDDVINISYVSVPEGGTPGIEEIDLAHDSDTAGQTSEGKSLYTIASFQPLFKEFSNLHILNSEYVLVGPITFEDWDRFKRHANRVKVFEVKEEDNTKISSSVFAQVLSKLSGQPLLPSLKTIHISNMYAFFGCAPFLVHLSLESVKVEIKTTESKITISTIPSPIDESSTMKAFLQLLITESPNIQDLHIDYSPLLITPSLAQIHCLANLRALDLGPFNDIRNISEITMLLEPMNSLEELRLVVGLVSVRYQLMPADTSSRLHMVNLVSLTIIARSQFLTEFMMQLDAPRLTSLDVESIGPSKVKKHIGQKHLTHSMGLSSIAGLRELRHLAVKGYISSIESLLVDEVLVWNNLRTFYYTSSQGYSFPMEVLCDITKRAAKLAKLSCPLDIKGTTAESLESLEPLAHPLEELVVVENEPVASRKGGVAADTTRQFVWGVTRSLYLLFPDLKRLTYSTGSRSVASFWQEVWERIKFCQAVVTDEKWRSRRRDIGVGTEASQL